MSNSTDEHRALVDRLDSMTSMLASLEERTGRRAPVEVEAVVNLSMAELDALYRGNDYAGRIVDKLPDECTRRGWQVALGGDVKENEVTAPFDDDLRRLNLTQAINRADKLARKDGGAAIYLSIDDGQQQDQPVDEKRIRGLRRLLVLERWHLQPDRWEGDIDKDGFGEPVTYLATPTSPGGGTAQRTIHRSRLLLFGGVWLPTRLSALNAYWPDSVLQRCARKINDFTRLEIDIGLIVRDFSQAVLKFKGLAAAASAGNSDALVARFTLMNMARNIAGMSIVDADSEELVYQTRSVAGLADLWDREAQSLASAAGMPMTMLFGQAPGGLSTDDNGGRTYWYDTVADRQVNVYLPHIEKVVRYLGLSKEGPTKGELPKEWSVRFRSLQEPSEADLVTMRKMQAETDKIYWEMGVVQDTEIRRSRFGAAGFNAETVLIEGEEAGGEGGAEERGDALRWYRSRLADSHGSGNANPEDDSPGQV